jgi:alanine racemase
MNITDTSLSKATVDLNKLLQNIASFKGLLSEQTNFMAVVKADAYSHGAVPAAQEIEKQNAADYFGVAQLSEALKLRDAGIKTPILIFNATRPDEIEYAIENDVTLTVFSVEMAEHISKVAQQMNETVKVHLKIDSGMGRLGVCTFEEALAIYKAFTSDDVIIEGIFTHFADADNDAEKDFTEQQFNHFIQIVEAFESHGITFDLRHCCNTAATISFPEYHLDMVRVGIGLYGFNPTHNNQDKISLSPLETIQTTVTYVKDFPEGESVGYNRTYFSPEPIRIATVAIGYADGVPKSLSNKGYFTYEGHRLPIIGQVCMDQIMLDVSRVEDLELGDLVTYFGDPQDDNFSASEVAETTQTSVYEILCRIGDRVQRVYQRSEG